MARLGELDAAIETYHAAESDVNGLERAACSTISVSRLYWKGGLAEAATKLIQASEELATYDTVSEAKARINLGAVLAEMARYDEAEAQLRGSLPRKIDSAAESSSLRRSRISGSSPCFAVISLPPSNTSSAAEGGSRPPARDLPAGCGSTMPAPSPTPPSSMTPKGCSNRRWSRFAEQGTEGSRWRRACSPWPSCDSPRARLMPPSLPRMTPRSGSAARRGPAGNRSPSFAPPGRGSPRTRSRTSTPSALRDVADDLAGQGWGREATRCRLVAARCDALSGETDDRRSRPTRAT